MKTLLQLEIENAMQAMSDFAQTRAFDSGVRDLLLEGYIKGLKRAQRLVRQQEKI